MTRPAPVALAEPAEEAVYSWTLLLPFTRPLSLNDRAHWRVKAVETARWRGAAHCLAREQRIGPCGRVRVTLQYAPRDRRRRDPDNLVAALKPCVDGLVDAKVVCDDTFDFVVRRMPQILPAGPEFAKGCRFALIIEELA